MNDDSGEQLLSIGARLESERSRLAAQIEAGGALARLGDEASRMHAAWSGSSLGYHARVYYQGLLSAPSGARFDTEWGFNDTFSNATQGSWVEYSSDEVIAEIKRRAGNPDLSDFEASSARLTKAIEAAKGEATSIISLELADGADSYLASANDKIEGVRLRSIRQLQSAMISDRRIITRDVAAVSGGTQIAPHQALLAEVAFISQPVGVAEDLVGIIQQAGSHLVRMKRRKHKASLVGTNVFIGHGQSPVWRDLKDFLGERLALPYDEFNRVPVAGFTNIARLSEMLDAAAIAFIVLTAEDEQSDGAMHARQNVIHEAGLFQGRLGFSRAIILLEEGCEEFSNIQGLGQIRFPRGNIRAKFEEIRQVLEREGLIG